jgi:hypothetical protein
VAGLAEQVAATKIIKKLDVATNRKNLDWCMISGTKSFVEMFGGKFESDEHRVSKITRGVAPLLRGSDVDSGVCESD